MSRSRKSSHGRCMWPECTEPGVYFIGRIIGLEKKWGYACEAHDRVVAAENMERQQEEAFFARSRVLAAAGRVVSHLS